MKELWLFTARFPHGTGEPFLENELPVLARRFRRIVIVPQLADVQGERPLPANVVVHPAMPDPMARMAPLDLLRYARVWRRALDLVRGSVPEQGVWRSQGATVRARLRQSLRRALHYRSTLFADFDPDRVLLYSYWTSDQATALAFLQMLDPRVHFVSRMHGFDLFAERSPDGWPPMRELHLTTVERVFVVSQAGLDYLRGHYPTHADKFELARLGTRDNGAGPWSPSDVLRIVSCSNLVPLKRVDLLLRALMQVGRPVQWTHFGGGPEIDGLIAMAAALPEHVRAGLMGPCPNSEVIAWYREHPVDLFVHLSASEGGVPVALQEAASFGIPLLAVDAGGVREIVGPLTGTLLSADPTPEAIAAALDAHRNGPHDTMAFRDQVRTVWSAGFRAEVNFGHFCDRLLGT